MASAQFDVMGGRLSYQDMMSQQRRTAQQGERFSQAASDYVNAGYGTTAQMPTADYMSAQMQGSNQNVYIPHAPAGPLTGLYYGNQPTKKEGIMKLFRDYLNTHRDLIFTVALVFIADHYLLNGALKERIQRLLEGILNKAESTLHKEIAK